MYCFSGNPCVLAIFFFSPLVSYGVMAMLYPLVHFHQSSLAYCLSSFPRFYWHYFLAIAIWIWPRGMKSKLLYNVKLGFGKSFEFCVKLACDWNYFVPPKKRKEEKDCLVHFKSEAHLLLIGLWSACFDLIRPMCYGQNYERSTCV